MIPFRDLRRVNAAHEIGICAGLARVIDSGGYILGEECAAFEREFAAFCGIRHCIGVANGLDALTPRTASCAVAGLRQHRRGVPVPVPAKPARVAA